MAEPDIWNKPWFLKSDIRVQIKRPTISRRCRLKSLTMNRHEWECMRRLQLLIIQYFNLGLVKINNIKNLFLVNCTLSSTKWFLSQKLEEYWKLIIENNFTKFKFIFMTVICSKTTYYCWASSLEDRTRTKGGFIAFSRLIKNDLWETLTEELYDLSLLYCCCRLFWEQLKRSSSSNTKSYAASEIK